MPKRRGIEVSVTDTNGSAYIEYGLSNDGKVSASKSKVYTHIEAKHNDQFLIHVEVDNPFNFEQEYDRFAFLKAMEKALKSNPAPQVTSQHNTRTKHFDHNLPVEEEVDVLDSAPSAGSKAPFDLMVAVFIDGRAKPECRQMIYLDPKHPRYNSSCVLKGRWVDPGDDSAREGKAGLLQWVFTDRGIDHILEMLNVTKDTLTDQEEPDVQEICDEMATRILQEAEEKPMKAGDIEVRFRRVITLESDPVEQKFKAYHYAGADEKPQDISDDCTHTTSFVPKIAQGGRSKIETFSLRHVAWNYFKKGEDAWAQFFFKYKGRPQLVKMNFCEPNGTPTLRGRIKAPEPDTFNQRGKKRAPGNDGNDSPAQRWAVESSIRQAPRSTSRAANPDKANESDIGEDAENADAVAVTRDILPAQGRYEWRSTPVKIDSHKKAPAKDDGENIS